MSDDPAPSLLFVRVVPVDGDAYDEPGEWEEDTAPARAEELRQRADVRWAYVRRELTA